MTDNRDPAKTRLLLLTLVRISGLIVAGIGFVLWQTPAFGAPQPLLGGVLFATGLIEMLAVPPLLLRRWRGPKP